MNFYQTKNTPNYRLPKFVLVFALIACCTACHGQKEIVKNGVRINKLDKKKQKQGSWFFFDEKGNLEISCYYKDDAITKPIVFYKNQDSAFVRYPKVDNSELFLLKSNHKWVVGSVETVMKDSLKIDLLGLYRKIGKDSLDIQEDPAISNSIAIRQEATYWIKKELQPVYMFGNETLGQFMYRLFSSSKYVFNKRIYLDLTLSPSGTIEKIEFPRDRNNLSSDEENELHYLVRTMMQRWQPFFSQNKTERVHRFVEMGTTLKKPLLISP